MGAPPFSVRDRLSVLTTLGKVYRFFSMIYPNQLDPACVLVR